ncbi:MAG: MerR family DNA-binding transcriptional regulator [Synergistaceae bacterium]|nr:MerR family DNA-binding transcriptional regulator [Synergistaceae bacterium]
MSKKREEEFKKNTARLRYAMNTSEAEEEEGEKHDGLLSVGELAKFARVTRSALIFYDNRGLIRPAERGDNNYRYYSPYQVTTANLINTLQELEVPLKEIADFTNHRTPEKIISLFSEQSKHIDRRIEKLLRAQKLLLTLNGIIEEGLSVDEEKIETRWNEEESILVGPQIDYSGGTTIEEALLDFYKHWDAADSDLDLNYPVWAIFSEERVKRGDWVGPDKFYFKMPDAPDRKPAGLYATGYSRGYYGQSAALYKRLIAHIEENGLEICGPAFETYPLNEISISDPYNYLMRVSIQVK